MGRRNPIHLVGEPIRKGFTMISDELIRSGAHIGALGPDGFLVLAYLLSCATAPQSNHRRPWETSAAQMNEHFGWPRNRRRVAAAIEQAIKSDRLLIREFVRPDGRPVRNRCAYVVCAGGRRFTDEERFTYSQPIITAAKPDEDES